MLTFGQMEGVNQIVDDSGQVSLMHFGCDGISITHLFADPTPYKHKTRTAVSDTSGNLLFYVIDSVIYDNKNNALATMDSFGYNYSFSVVPYPGNFDLYYIFYFSLAPHRYETIKYCLYNLKTKSIVQRSCFWDIPGRFFGGSIKHANKKFYLVTFVNLDGGGELFTYLIDSNGLSHKLYWSNLYWSNIPGDQCLFAPNGSDLYAIIPDQYAGGYISWQPFNKSIDSRNAYGQSMYIIYYRDSGQGGTGYYSTIEFSPDSKKLYLYHDFRSSLHQYDVSEVNRFDTSYIGKSRTYLTGNNSGYFMRAPDAKIYTMVSDVPAVINKPSNPGKSCDLQIMKKFHGLVPESAPALTRQGYWPSFSIDTDVYNPFLIHFSYNDPQRGYKYKWDFGDAGSGNKNQDTAAKTYHFYSLGHYSVRLVVTDTGYDEIYKQITTDSLNYSDGFKREICLNNPFLHIVHDTTACSGKIIVMNSGNPFCSHLWSTGDTTEIVTLTKPGKYWVQYRYKNLFKTDSFFFKYDRSYLSKKYLPEDTTICDDFPLTIKLDSVHGSIQWQDTVASKVFTVSKAGFYHAILKNDCGIYPDSIHINTIPCPCTLYAPNNFTPNEDGINDTFKIQPNCDISSFELVVYNRWGEMVFKSKDTKNGWDGLFHGHDAPYGLYIYNAAAVTNSGKTVKVNGILNLTR